MKGPSELKLSITIAPSKTVADLKETIASKSDVEKDRQRLIYSGEWEDVMIGIYSQCRLLHSLGCHSGDDRDR